MRYAFAEVAQPDVAGVAQETAYSAGRVVVIERQLSLEWLYSANFATSILSVEHTLVDSLSVS